MIGLVRALIVFYFVVFFTRSDSLATMAPAKNYFITSDGCFLLYNLKTEKLELVVDEKNCKQRLTACSTFKFPLALMAFDSNVIEDENTKFKWDGVHRSIESWNQDQTALSWIRESVVWVSQQITPKLGAESIRSYLKKFNYGNQDMSAGLTSAWLTITKTDSDSGKGSLKISAFEQLDFLKHFWKHEMPVSSLAWEKTNRVTFIQKSPSGFDFSGKTGSGYLENLKGEFGWFVGHIQGNGKEYVMVTNFIRNRPASDSTFPGPKAREITKQILNDRGLW